MVEVNHRGRVLVWKINIYQVMVIMISIFSPMATRALIPHIPLGRRGEHQCHQGVVPGVLLRTMGMGLVTGMLEDQVKGVRQAKGQGDLVVMEAKVDKEVPEGLADMVVKRAKVV